MEGALVMSLLVPLTFGCIEWGHFFFVKHTLQGASREGARAAAVPGSVRADVTLAVNQSLASSGISPTSYTIHIRNAADTGDIDVVQTAGTAIRVKVQSVWSDVGLRPMNIISRDKVIVGQTTMRKEG
ncbi:MAG TPA: TadE family protein [Tepidisphaeraceae bacterium]|jgi:Flp pilus assembly protein TadG